MASVNVVTNIELTSYDVFLHRTVTRSGFWEILHGISEQSENEASPFVRRAGFFPLFFIVLSGGFGFGRNIGLGVRTTTIIRL